MATLSASRRKVIDIKPETFRSLSIMAAEHGTNLKHFIEFILDKAAAKDEDSELYTWLLQNEPEGKIMATAEEKQDFEKWLDV